MNDAVPSPPPPPPANPPARLTPYELVFLAAAAFEERIFPGIREEAERMGVDALRRDAFGFLSRAGDAIREIVPTEAPAEALEQHRALLYHAFNFWRFGRRIYALEPAVARFLVEGAPALAGWALDLPYPSLYLQLPPRLFWASITPSGTPEPVDGFFVTLSDAVDPGGAARRVEVLAVLGIRRDRAGFSVIPFESEVGPGIAAVWAEAPGREGGVDFQNVLPGGEMTGLYSILTNTEALKLVARSLWYVSSYPADAVPEQLPASRAAHPADAPPPARLPFYRVTLSGGVAEDTGS